MQSIEDHRAGAGRILGVREVKRWGVIPVDQYLVLRRSLTRILEGYLQPPAPAGDATLVIENLSYWQDTSPWFHAGWVVNGATRLLSGEGDTLSTWQWEYRRKPQRTQAISEVIGTLTADWLEGQQNVLAAKTYRQAPSNYRYRRQLLLWVDTIVVPDGYILDGRMSLYFPADQIRTYSRGIPSVHYRHSSVYESIAIGGRDQHWFRRFSPSLLGRLGLTGRIGFNRFDERAFDYVDWWNIFLINLAVTATVEYQPSYYRGLYAGLGIHQSINILPENIDRFIPGLVFTLGVRLP